MIEKFNEWYKWIRKPNKSLSEQLFEFAVFIIPLAFVIRTFIYGLYQVPTGSMETTLLVGERFFADKFTVLFNPIERGDIISFNDPQFPYTKPTSRNIIKRTVQRLKNFWEHYVYGPQNWTKRVIAVPGDEIKGVIENGKTEVYLKKSGEKKFKKLEETYLNKYPLIPAYQPQDSHGGLAYRSYDPLYSYSNQPYYSLTEEEVRMGEQKALSTGNPTIKEPRTPEYTLAIADGKYRLVNVDQFGPYKMGPNQYWVMGDNRLNSSDSRVWGILDRSLIHGKIVYRIWSLDSYSSWWIIDLIKHPVDFWKKVRWTRCMQKVS